VHPITALLKQCKIYKIMTSEMLDTEEEPQINTWNKSEVRSAHRRKVRSLAYEDGTNLWITSYLDV
jgi:hypothetical protein